MTLADDWTTPSPEGGSDLGEALITEYGASLSDHLAGRIVAKKRVRAWEDAVYHLEDAWRDHIDEGLDSYEAARQAIESYGTPHDIAIRIIEGDQDDRIGHPWGRKLGYSRLLALCIYGVGQLVASIYQSERWARATDAGYTMPLAPAKLRAWVPEPWPLPQTPHELFALYGIPYLWPLVASFVFGICGPARPVSATLVAMVLLDLHAFVQASLMLPSTAGLLNALLCLFIGIPLACLGSLLGTSVRRSWQIRREGINLMRKIDA